MRQRRRPARRRLGGLHGRHQHRRDHRAAAGTTTPGGSTDTDGIQGTPGSTGTSGIPGTIPGTTTGLTPGTGGGAGDPITTFSPLRPSVSGSLPFTGVLGDLLALAAAGLLAAGALIVRAARPAAATEGGGDR